MASANRKLTIGFRILTLLALLKTQMRTLTNTILSVIALLSAINAKAGALDIDLSKSSIDFKIKHMLMMTADGKFKELSGSVEKDDTHFLNSKVNFKASTASVFTDNEDRDKHLRTADFFDVEKYPEATFVSTKIEPAAEKKYALYGDLTIHGKTKNVKFDLEESQVDGKSVYTASTTLDRLEFGVGQSSIMIGDKVKLSIKLTTK